MSRAFVIEAEDRFHCILHDVDCKHANLRGRCELDKCEIYGELEKEDKPSEDK